MVTLEMENENWEVCVHRHTPMGTTPDISMNQEWEFRPTALPFDAISWLHYIGVGPDPLVDSNDFQYRWTEDVDWVLRKTFTITAGAYQPEDELQLALKDVDCFFDIFLNGHQLGSGRNQFREHVFDVDESMLEENNVLLIYIRSARNITSMMESAYGQLPAGFDTGRVHARRCQTLSGWDWTPRLSSVSMLKAPVLRKLMPITISNPYVHVAVLPPVQPGQTSVEVAQATVIVDLHSRRRAVGDLGLRIIDTRTGQVVLERRENITIKPKPTHYKRAIEIPDAKLWWPLGMGSQPLYKLEVTLAATDRFETTYDLAASTTFGVRTATIDQTKDAIGESFIPVINGLPVFCRGANWIPTTMLQSAARSEDYRTLISAAVGAGMNCLRVWAGGIYETDEFYDLCDQSGILVWQDFMFTCAAYPTYRDFLDEVEAETIYQVTRLRNHPSIFLWCGNNENEWLHQTGDLKKGNEQKIIGETIWSHLIRQLVEDYDPSRVYHQSSPYGRNKTDYNDQRAGDRHSWDAWAGWQHTDSLLLDQGRFITEFGIQAYPALESIKTFAPGAHDVNHYELAYHQKMIEGGERMSRYVAAHYNLPVNLTEWIETSQAMQAEILRRAVENWRRLRFNTAGVLIWQLHDAYPAISWSLIDYYRRPKTAWQSAKQFFSPVLLTMELTVNGKPASAIAPEQWLKNLVEESPKLPVAGGELMACSTGHPVVQTRFVLVNDTSHALSGDLVVEFLRCENDHVVLDTHTVSVEPNGIVTGLTHDINQALMRDISRLTIRATWTPDEHSREALATLEQSVREIQAKLLPGNVSESIWKFSADAGLSLMVALVDPKHYRGTMVAPGQRRDCSLSN